MSGRFGNFVILLAAAGAAPACASAMSAPKGELPYRCNVIGGDKLPAKSGGEAALCEAVSRAFVTHSVGAAYHAEIKVLSASRLSAHIIANGRRLPEQVFNSMDRPLAKSSFERFAESLARQAAGRNK